MKLSYGDSYKNVLYNSRILDVYCNIAHEVYTHGRYRTFTPDINPPLPHRTKFDFNWGTAPDPTGGAQRSTRPSSWI